MKVRLNFSISEALYARLGRYCDEVGMTQSSLVRQLILEYLDDEVPLPDLTIESGMERRTSLLLPHQVFESFEGKAKTFRVTKSRLVSGLIRLFLEKRENVNVDVSDEPDYKGALEDLVRTIISCDDDYDLLTKLPLALAPAVELLGLTEELRESTKGVA